MSIVALAYVASEDCFGKSKHVCHLQKMQNILNFGSKYLSYKTLLDLALSHLHFLKSAPERQY